MNGERTEVYCTKVGTTRPHEMYIVGGHMDGHGVNEAVNDDGSGTALVMELARIFNAPDVETEVSIRFALWNNEETGTNGARAYITPQGTTQEDECNDFGSRDHKASHALGVRLTSIRQVKGISCDWVVHAVLMIQVARYCSSKFPEWKRMELVSFAAYTVKGQPRPRNSPSCTALLVGLNGE